jgi:23S rRNA (pseudouridine1915-N3)-methyltransferase
VGRRPAAGGSLKLRLLVVGRDKGPTAALTADYLARLPWSAEIKELTESRQRSADARKAEEGAALLAALPPKATLVALDRGGQVMSSEAFAEQVARWRDGGVRELVFVIGGPDGLDAAVLAKAERKLAFGPMTWPHLLARAMLAEQLWRAASILAGHPYHR